MVDIKIPRGQFKVIRVDGTEESFLGRPTIGSVSRRIGASTLDTVLLDRKRQIVMMVDDTGMIDGKPANPKATVLYHSICKPGTVHAIHGDVAIVNDGDFA